MAQFDYSNLAYRKIEKHCLQGKLITKGTVLVERSPVAALLRRLGG